MEWRVRHRQPKGTVTDGPLLYITAPTLDPTAAQQVGQGNGELAATLVGMVAGAIAGGVAEHVAQNRDALAYTITLHSGKTVTIAQYYKKGDPEIKVGNRVMVQTSGTYQRVLPASHLPTKIKRPKAIEVTD